MSPDLKERKALREDEKMSRQKAMKAERDDLIKRYLPAEEAHHTAQTQNKSRLGVRKFIKSQLFVILYVLIHAIFSVCIRIRIACNTVSLRVASILNHHHNTPEYVRKDISTLGRVPKHVSVILTLENGGRSGDALEKLVNEVSEVAAWCASAGIASLSVYEKTGALKRFMPQVHRAASQKLADWFGKYHAPSLSVHARGFSTIQPQNQKSTFGMMLISADDGRGAMVDLTKVFAQMVQKNKITTADITSDVIDNELTEAVMAEPDLLISFEPYVDLQGYPPWQMRLTEIFCAHDNQGVSYQVFIRGLHKYAEATFKMGK